jgi:predicted nicotinamide N-methyase
MGAKAILSLREMTAAEDPDALALNARLERLSPGARLVRRAHPLVPEVPLWLMNADYPEGRLGHEGMHALLAEPPYWAFCWGCGAVLARWLLDHPESVRGRSVLDVGSGGGIVAIAAARCGARRVIACDADPLALLATRANARANGVAVEPCADFEQAGAVDVIVAADILYDLGNLPLLARFRERAATVFVADSRVKDFAAPGYEKIWSQECRVEPDLVEAESVNRPTVYRAEQR